MSQREEKLGLIFGDQVFNVHPEHGDVLVSCDSSSEEEETPNPWRQPKVEAALAAQTPALVDTKANSTSPTALADTAISKKQHRKRAARKVLNWVGSVAKQVPRPAPRAKRHPAPWANCGFAPTFPEAFGQ